MISRQMRFGARASAGKPRHRAGRGSCDRGNAVVEAAILTPLLVLLLAVLLVAGRLRYAGAVITQAAADAARQASIARTATEARAAATNSALATLRYRQLRCSPQVALDVTGFSRPPGQAVTVTVRVTCVVQLADLALPGIPTSRTVTKVHRSPLDVYRGRG
jgi:Flp pilus assembly protein TadG